MLLGEGVDHARVPLVQGCPQVGEQHHRRSTQRPEVAIGQGVAADGEATGAGGDPGHGALGQVGLRHGGWPLNVDEGGVRGGGVGLGGDEDLAAGPAGQDLLQRFGGLLERQDPVDDRAQHATVDQGGDRAQRLAVGVDEQEAVGDAELPGLSAQRQAQDGQGQLDDLARAPSPPAGSREGSP